MNKFRPVTLIDQAKGSEFCMAGKESVLKGRLELKVELKISY